MYEKKPCTWAFFRAILENASLQSPVTSEKKKQASVRPGAGAF
ncbi:hypothetical protein HMPREF9069_00757 [Atopobium sp. oral taxon 810 str. F0209]|nr:hypothetical protein HMPREF9069_00757 [Atopobium sp. oral taxon 810 str. F0209]